MGRINQIRDVILERRKEDRSDLLRVEEMVTVFLSQSIHGAAGNSKGVRAASKFSLQPKEPKKISSRQARQLSGGSLEPAFTQEDIDAEVKRLQGEK